MVFLFAGAAAAAEEAPFHIGIMTGTVSQSEDDLRGAELMIQKYGNSAERGMITHLTYPDNFMSEMETTIGQIVGLADDPKMRVIVVNQAIPGTAEGFRRVREKRPDIILLAGTAQEDPAVITAAADVATIADLRFCKFFVNRYSGRINIPSANIFMFYRLPMERRI